MPFVQTRKLCQIVWNAEDRFLLLPLNPDGQMDGLAVSAPPCYQICTPRLPLAFIGGSVFDTVDSVSIHN